MGRASSQAVAPHPWRTPERDCVPHSGISRSTWTKCEFTNSARVRTQQRITKRFRMQAPLTTTAARAFASKCAWDAKGIQMFPWYTCGTRRLALRPRAAPEDRRAPEERHSLSAPRMQALYGMSKGFKCSVGTRAEFADSRFVHVLRLRTGALRKRGILWAPPGAGVAWDAKGIQVFRWYTCGIRRLALRPRAAPEDRRAPVRHSLNTPGCRRCMGCQGDSNVPLVHVRNSQTRASSTCCA